MRKSGHIGFRVFFHDFQKRIQEKLEMWEYLKALDEQEEASKIIVMGYVKPILDHINNEETKKEIEQNFEKYLVD